MPRFNRTLLKCNAMTPPSYLLGFRVWAHKGRGVSTFFLTSATFMAIVSAGDMPMMCQIHTGDYRVCHVRHSDMLA